MQYREDRTGQRLSVLGFGCMRLPKKAGSIDFRASERLICRAVEGGVNYIDTAYLYPGSEAALGEILEKNGLRDKVHIATKLPQYLVKKTEGFDHYFLQELERLRTGYVDYYLLHMLTDYAAWQRLCSLGIREWIAEKKAAGQIRSIGFSFHGNSGEFLKILEDYDWDFCQIQYNYMDETTQAGRRGLERAYEKGVPVMIMEPLRGGRMVNYLPEAAKKRMAAYPIQRSAAQWSFRWLWDQPGVTVVLSGMNTMEMLEENLRYADEAAVGCMTEADEALIARVKEDILGTLRVNCTGCAYCMPCPRGIQIPAVFSAYNRMAASRFAGWKDYVMTAGLGEKLAYPSDCVGCGRCEAHCPQALPIRELLKEANRPVTPWFVRLGVGAIRMVKK